MARGKLLVVTAACLGLAGCQAAADDAERLLEVDDECGADEACALNALQMRVRSLAREAARGSERRGDADVAPWAQCGGSGYTGPSDCGAAAECVSVDRYYAECVPSDQVEHFKEQQAKQKEAQKANERAQKKANGEEDEDNAQDPLEEQEPLPRAPKVGGADAVVIKGNFMYNSKTGARFFAKGVAYNPRNMVYDRRLMKYGNCTPGVAPAEKLSYGADPSASDLASTWKAALNAIAVMGANTVRLYNINPELSHKDFMDYAASLGLYVIIPLTRHDWGWLPAGSPSPLCYSEELDGYGNVGTNVLTSAKMIVREFSQYENTLLFTVANEMTVADKNGYAAFPCVKALTRDIHQYQASCNTTMRRVPLIYADMDMGPPYRELVGRYLACELEGPDDAVDAYGLNVYSWCDKEFPDETGKHNFEYSPYSAIRDEFKHFSIPLLFTEFGCTQGQFMTWCPYRGGRTFPDVQTFFNEFKEVMSGAVAFEFSMEDNQYGLALTPGFTSDPNNDEKFYYLDSYFALKKEFEKYSVASEWDGAVVDDCAWTPGEAHKLKETHKQAECPALPEVKALFEAKDLLVEPNWHELPPTPARADEGPLAVCPEYEVAPALFKEGCCHNGCSNE